MKFREKKITITLDINSSNKQIKDFLETYINFKEEIVDLDGKKFFVLTEETMENLGFKFGQRKRLIKYINYFKSLNQKQNNNKEILISKKSSEEEVSKFLKLKFHFSQKIINELKLNAERLFKLQVNDIDKFEMLTLEQRQKLKQFIKENSTKFEEEKEKIKLDRNSTVEDLYKFLKKKLNFSDKSIKFIQKQEFDCETFLNLTYIEIKYLEGISNQEKERLKLFLNEYNLKKKENQISKLEINFISKTENIKKENDNEFKILKDNIIKEKEKEQKEKNITKLENLNYFEKEEEITKKIMNYLDHISIINIRRLINLRKLIINYNEYYILGLIFKIKMKLINRNNICVNEKSESNICENNIIKEIFKIIVPTFSQEIILSLLFSKLPQKYKILNNYSLEVYKNHKHYNFYSFFKNLKSKRNIIYTFSKRTKNLFRIYFPLKNSYGEYKSENILNVDGEPFESEENLVQKLKEFIESKNHKILVIKLNYNCLNKANSISIIISNLEREYTILNNKIIIFIIFKQREMDKLNRKLDSDFIQFNDYRYDQIFIDDLNGNDNTSILNLLEKIDTESIKKYLIESCFIEKKIFIVFNYMNYKIHYEIKDLNNNNYPNKISEKIINDMKIKELIYNNIKIQPFSIEEIIEKIFRSNYVENNNIEFLEVIKDYLSDYFYNYLTKIIYYAFKENVLNELLFNVNNELILQNEYFKGLINKIFSTTEFNFKKSLNMKINRNIVEIYNELKIPKLNFISI